MADEYRRQLELTGMRALSEVAEVVLRPDHYWKIGNAQAYLHGWYVKLSRALGNEKGLEDLKKSWMTLAELNKLCLPYYQRCREQIPVEMRDPVLKLAMLAQSQLDRFLKKLPRVTEKCLTHAVRTSGIRLR